jgi:hypothetical protein
MRMLDRTGDPAQDWDAGGAADSDPGSVLAREQDAAVV